MTPGTPEQLRVLRRAANGVPLTTVEKAELWLLVAALTDRATRGVFDAMTETERLHRDYHWLKLPELPTTAVKKMRYMLAYSADPSLVSMHWTSGLLMHGCGFTEQVLASLKLSAWVRTGTLARGGLYSRYVCHFSAARQAECSIGLRVPLSAGVSLSTSRAMQTERESLRKRYPMGANWLAARFPEWSSPKTGSAQPRSDSSIPPYASSAQASATLPLHMSLDTIDALWYGWTPMVLAGLLRHAFDDGLNS